MVPRHVEFRCDLLGERRHRIRHGDEPRLRNAACEIPRVDASEPSQTDQSNCQSSFSRSRGHFTVSLVTSSSFTLTSVGGVSPRITFTAFSTGHAPHFRRELRDRRRHRPRRNRLLRIVERVEPDDADLARLAGGRQRFDRPERHQIAAGEDAVDVGMRLQHVLEHGEALIALPVGRLRRDDRDAGRPLDRVLESAEDANRRFRGPECPRGWRRARCRSRL
jgi:hypothetical protein